MLSCRREVWWTSGDASFEPQDVAELRVTACELLPEDWYEHSTSSHGLLLEVFIQ